MRLLRRCSFHKSTTKAVAQLADTFEVTTVISMCHMHFFVYSLHSSYFLYNSCFLKDDLLTYKCQNVIKQGDTSEGVNSYTLYSYACFLLCLVMSPDVLRIIHKCFEPLIHTQEGPCPTYT